METQSRYHDTRGCSAGMCPLFWPWSQAERELLNQWAKQIKCDPWQKDAWYALMLHWYGWYGWNQRLDAWDTMTYHEDLLTQQTLQISSDCFRQSSSFFSASQCKCLQNSTDLYYTVYISDYICVLCVYVFTYFTCQSSGMGTVRLTCWRTSHMSLWDLCVMCIALASPAPQTRWLHLAFAWGIGMECGMNLPRECQALEQLERLWTKSTDVYRLTNWNSIW